MWNKQIFTKCNLAKLNRAKWLKKRENLFLILQLLKMVL